MEIHNLSACYFPTRVLLVDDKPTYLKNLESILDPDLATYESYSDQHKVLSYLVKDYRPSHFIEQIVSHTEELQLHHRNIDVDINAIHQQIYNPDRFAEISVLAIDYSMPGLTGSQICEKIKGSLIQKLMLTGEADDKLAIDLLNRKTIDQFISKANTSFTDVVNETIQKLQKDYFIKLTQIIVDSLVYSKEHHLSCIQDSEYIELFNKFYNGNHCAEYYLLDGSGSFLFLSIKGKPSYFVVRSEEDMQTAEELVQLSDHSSPKALKSLKAREKLLFLPSENNQVKDSSDWEKALYPATKLNTQSGTFYYSYIKEPTAFNLDQSKIVSFETYLEEHSQ
ncbi:MAG TPA: hypothetical protein VD770_01090 [Coxiellaceae bacterium]|nr:hypothetical protein [Coxiellaceae bacterium]